MRSYVKKWKELGDVLVDMIRWSLSWQVYVHGEVYIGGCYYKGALIVPLVYPGSIHVTIRQVWKDD